MIVKGRAAIGDLFAGFCKDPKDGGLKGMHFAPEHSTTIENTFATQWVATAPFLTEPYRGSDAYITHDGYMQAMVTTFDGGASRRSRRRSIFGYSACFESTNKKAPRRTAGLCLNNVKRMFRSWQTWQRPTLPSLKT